MALAGRMLDPDDQVLRIRYFTADVSPRAGDEDAPIRQATYFRALKTIPELSIHKGRFLPKRKRRPLVGQEDQFVEIHDTEEKGSDVNLASHLLMDGFLDRYDVALVLSQDTDLLEPMRMVRDELQKKLVVGWFEQNQPGKKHRAIASSIRHISNAQLEDSQFPDPVIGRGGAKIFRPESWSPT